MTYRISFNPAAQRDLDKMEPQARQRLLRYLSERIVLLEDARCLGEPLLASQFFGYWRYRVGDYRITCDIQDEELHILVVKGGNRRVCGVG
ncbi:MAG: Plasmid stabilization system [Nitrosospira multiformis]|jgi:mRNA interferase RelE/StbE|nr:Plasmid stabilization system [Nitrosospira multiformis]